jgi:hypothetical protein
MWTTQSAFAQRRGAAQAMKPPGAFKAHPSGPKSSHQTIPERGSSCENESELPKRRVQSIELDRSAELREQAARSQAQAAQLARRAARRLRDQGLPLQDVGTALGVSFQRAKQLIDEADKLAS